MTNLFFPFRKLYSLLTILSILLICLRALKTTAHGDISIDPGSSLAQTLNFEVRWFIDHQNITFLIKFHNYCYFALNYNPTMTNADMTIIEIDNSTITVHDYWSTGHTKPALDSHEDITVLGYDTDGSSYITVKFMRPLNTGSSQDSVLKLNQQAHFVLAFSKNKNLKLNYHAKNLEFFSAELKNKVVAKTTQNLSPEVIQHGVIQTICWCFLADISIFLLTFKYSPWFYVAHSLLFLLTIILSLWAGIVTWIRVGGFNLYQFWSEQYRAHAIIALIILCWCVIQILTGIFSRMMQLWTNAHPKVILLSTWIHRCSGYTMWLLCKSQCILGWYNVHHSAFAATLTWSLFSFLVMSLKKLNYKRISYETTIVRPAQTKYQIGLKDKMEKYPYNHPQLRNQSYVIFSDFVWDLSALRGFHPGGSKIIEMVKGREIDRFIYGEHSVEEIDNFKPWCHSEDCLKALGQPLFKINTQIPYPQIEPQGMYYVSTKQEYAPMFYVLHLRPVSGFPFKLKLPEDLSYLGQYYTVTGYGSTRLYTTVHSCMEENRLFVEKILIRYGYIDQQDYHITTYKPTQPRNNTVDRTEQTTLHGLSPETLKRTYNFSSSSSSSSSIPIIVKKYRDGKFTSRLINIINKENIVVQPPKGMGLGFHKVPPGKIIIFAAGTGIFPFFDLIDNLFKYVLLQTGKISAAQAHQHNPAIEIDTFQGYEFVLYGSFRRLSDILRTHLNMLRFVACEKPDFLNLYIRLSHTKNIDPNSSQYDGINFIHQRYDKAFLEANELHKGNYSMMYLCGPQSMTANLLKGMRQLQADPSKIYLV